VDRGRLIVSSWPAAGKSKYGRFLVAVSDSALREAILS
jgi:hypothetical protein